MSELALLWFFNRETEERIGQDVESPFIPRIGELVNVNGETWRVEVVDYLWPSPGSMNYNEGKRRPTVQILVSAARGPFALGLEE